MSGRAEVARAKHSSAAVAPATAVDAPPVKSPEAAIFPEHWPALPSAPSPESRAVVSDAQSAGVGSSAAEGSSTKLRAAADAYDRLVWARVASRKPAGLHLDGEAVAAFSLDAGGRLIDVTLVRSSGDRMLDTLAVRTIRRSAPFPTPPPDLDAEARRFTISFQFR
jgi:protein TonB